jgi:hypothetical protein
VGAVPSWLLRHTAVIEPFDGSGPAGPIYGPPVTVKCFHDAQVKLIRTGTGTELVAVTLLIAPLGTVCPAGSRVTVNGKRSTVFAALRRDGGGLPTPDHLEVQLQ